MTAHRYLGEVDTVHPSPDSEGLSSIKEASVSQEFPERITPPLHGPHDSPGEIRPMADPRQEATFLGWQKTPSGAIFPLYNIVKADHPMFMSTVSETTLRREHLRIPRSRSPYSGVEPSPWHNLGTELVNPATAREAIESAGLNYTVVKMPMMEFVGRDIAGGVSDRWVTVRTDTGEVLGIVGEKYDPVQNRDAFAFFDNLIGSYDATYETAGIIGRGERAWVLAKLPGFIKVHGNDIVGKYLLLSNTHDGSSHVRIKVTPIRVVCNNTLTAALKGGGEVHFRPASGPSENLKEALALLLLTDHLYQDLDAVFNRMALTKITDEQLLEYVKSLVPDDKDEADAEATESIRKTFLKLYETGQGADLSRGTLWGAFNCVTEFTDHEMEGNASNRLESIWFGQGEELKLRAFRLAERLM
jgi:phage/plasmid-like protein (TIGR03299 family)